MMEVMDSIKFNEYLEYFTNTPPFRSTKYDDPIATKQYKEELNKYIWIYFQNNLDYFDDCIYNGLVYRVLDCQKSKVYFDNYITHWSYDIDSFISKVKGFDTKHRYTWITANIKNGFDVTQYDEYHNSFIDFECEIIFPMSKDSVIDVFYGTYDEFVKHRERKFEK